MRCALCLAPLVFVRLGELVTAEWDGIDFKAVEWRYAVTKTGRPHMEPLARQAVAILREVHSMTGHHRYVFPNARFLYRELPMSLGTLWSAFRAMDIPKERMMMHGFRARWRARFWTRCWASDLTSSSTSWPRRQGSQRLGL